MSSETRYVVLQNFTLNVHLAVHGCCCLLCHDVCPSDLLYHLPFFALGNFCCTILCRIIKWTSVALVSLVPSHLPNFKGISLLFQTYVTFRSASLVKTNLCHVTERQWESQYSSLRHSTLLQSNKSGFKLTQMLFKNDNQNGVTES